MILVLRRQINITMPWRPCRLSVRLSNGTMTRTRSESLQTFAFMMSYVVDTFVQCNWDFHPWIAGKITGS